MATTIKTEFRVQYKFEDGTFWSEIGTEYISLEAAQLKIKVEKNLNSDPKFYDDSLEWRVVERITSTSDKVVENI